MTMNWTRMGLVAAAVLGVMLSSGSRGCVAAERAEVVLTAEPAPLRTSSPLRGVWVTRFDYIEPDDVRTIMRNASQMGFTDVFWQVRGQGDAYYQSELEPWGELLFRDSNDDKTPPTRSELRRGPGYDPLTLAAAEAHKRGLRLHAWMNVMPLWKGKAEPAAAAHPWRAKRSWRLRDDHGREQVLNAGYVIVNPVLDAVGDHIAAVARDIASRYDIDGLHLDYVRFVAESLEEGRVYPGDPVSLALYRQHAGLDVNAKVDPAALRAWVRGRITDLVTRISGEAAEARPGVTMSAAVWRRPGLAREKQLQDAAAWANRGVVDLVVPMLYTDDDAQFRGDLRAWTIAVHRRGAVVPGIGVYKHGSGRQTAGQARMLADDSRFVLFAYSSLFASRAPGSVDTPEAEGERLRRRVPLRTIMRD